MRAFLAVLRADLRSKVPLIVWLSISLSVSVSGPFGSYDSLTVLQRFLFWPPLIGVSVLMASAIRALVYGPMARGGTFGGILLTTALNCLLLVPPLFFAIRPVATPLFSDVEAFWEITILVFALSMGVSSLRLSAHVADPVAAAEPVAPEQPRILRRIDSAFQGQLWAISVRDHYVDVQTSAGTHSLLLRFSDAIAEAEPVSGTQVHRSHWVAWDGVGSVCREGGKVLLSLHNGSQIPVSRNHRDKVDQMFPPTADFKGAVA